MASEHPFPTARDIPPSIPRRIADGILNLLFPQRCLACALPVARQQDCGVCGSCWEKTLRLEIGPPICPSCGIPFQVFEAASGHLCGKCSLDLPPFSGARSFGYYGAELSRLIRGFKFEDRRNLSALLAPLLAEAFSNSWDRAQFDMIVPVPLHPERRRERGYNQSAILAHSLGHLIGIPAVESALSRVNPTLPQVGLTDAERAKNVRGAFTCRKPGRVAGKRILLVDDVMTTGATVRSAACSLLDCGALRVSVLTVARAVPGIE